MADRELSNALGSGEITSINLGGITTDDKVLKKSEIDAAYTTQATTAALDVRVTANEDFIANPKPVIQFEPQAVQPTHSEGQFYYDAVIETFKAQGPFPGVEVEVGHSMHTHVVNNSGAIIEKGSACRHNGVAGGIVQVVKALADSFVNAEVFGIASAEIAIGAEGAITTFGEIRDLDTNGLPTGTPLYLSDTVAGTYTAVKPSILSQVGGAVTADALTGRLFVSIVSNKNVPTVFSGMQGQTTPLYSVTVTPQDIDGYVSKTEVVMGSDLTTGITTLSNDGGYRLHFTADITFPTSTSTRTVYVDLYDVTNTTAIYTYTKNIPRDATEDGFSFSWPFSDDANTQYKMRIYSSVAIDVTFVDVSFDIQSVSIV